VTEERYYLALDQGGHASRAILFGVDGKVVAAAERAIETHRSGDTRVEHDPLELVATLRDAAAEVVASLPTHGGHRVVAGLATQRSSLVFWDRESGRPLSPVLSWQDRRGGAWLDETLPPGSDFRESVYAETGLVVSPHYGASKFRWCLRELPEVRAAYDAGTVAAGPLASYLLFALLEERPMAADPANAARTQLVGLESGEWSDRLLDLFEVPKGLLPPIRSSRFDFGTLAVGGERVPLQLLTGDQSAALFGFGDPPPGRVSVNAGTGAFLQLRGEGDLRVEGLLTATVFEGEGVRIRSVEGSVNGAAAALHAVAGAAGIDSETLHRSLDTWAESHESPPLFLNGVSGLASPFWQPSFPTAFLADGVDHGPPSQLVGVLESIVFLIVENLRAIDSSKEGRTESDRVAADLLRVEELVLSGGLSRSVAFRRRLAALAGVPVLRSSVEEATARGVAWLLGCRAMEGLPEGTESVESTPVPELSARFATWQREMRARMSVE